MASVVRDKAISDQKADEKVANQQNTPVLLRITIRRLKSVLSDAQERLDPGQVKAGDGKFVFLVTHALVFIFFFFFFFFFFWSCCSSVLPSPQRCVLCFRGICGAR
jgi:hypothetical protein